MRRLFEGLAVAACFLFAPYGWWIIGNLVVVLCTTDYPLTSPRVWGTPRILGVTIVILHVLLTLLTTLIVIVMVRHAYVIYTAKAEKNNPTRMDD